MQQCLLSGTFVHSFVQHDLEGCRTPPRSMLQCMAAENHTHTDRTMSNAIMQGMRDQMP